MKDANYYLTKNGILKPVVTRKYTTLMSDLFMTSYAELVHYKKLFFVILFLFKRLSLNSKISILNKKIILFY